MQVHSLITITVYNFQIMTIPTTIIAFARNTPITDSFYRCSNRCSIIDSRMCLPDLGNWMQSTHRISGRNSRKRQGRLEKSLTQVFTLLIIEGNLLITFLKTNRLKHFFLVHKFCSQNVSVTSKFPFAETLLNQRLKCVTDPQIEDKINIPAKNIG